jgi:hypothetical protein
MNKAVASLALLKVNWDNLRRDYIDGFVPFVVTLMQKKRYDTIEVDTIRADFESEYGLSIPYHPMIAILDRARRQGYIRKSRTGLYLPVERRVAVDGFTDIATEQERKYRKVINEFLKYCREEYDIAVSESEADAAFVSFLREYDLDILFIAQERSSLLPELGASTAHKFLVKSFVTHAYECEPEIFAFIADMSAGHIIANTLLHRDYDKFKGRLESCNFYLDIGFLFNVTGINGPEKREAYREFVKLLSSHQARTLVFRHTYDEYRGIMESCLQWIDSDYFDPFKASRALMYFKDQGFTASDVEQFILSVDSNLSEMNIEMVDRPDPSIDQVYQIDEERLQELIVEVYRQGDPYFDEEEKGHTIYLDVRSISAVCKLRRGHKPTRLQNANHVFVTTNSSLAYASRLFELEEADCTYFFIPTVLTDMLVGTIVWIHSPSKVSINDRRLIANCYAALQPSKALIKRLVDAADRLTNEGEITAEEVTILKESRVARNLLQRETLGDPDRFTDKTAVMVLEEIRARIRREEQETYREKEERYKAQLLEAQRNARLAKEEQSAAITAKEKIEGRAEALAERAANWVGVLFYVLSGVVVVTVLILQAIPTIIGNSKTLNYFLLSIAAALSAANMITGFNVKGTRDTIKQRLKAHIVSYLRG